MFTKEEAPELYYKLSEKKGAYTFILEAGLGNTSATWEVSTTEPNPRPDSVVGRLEKLGRVFSYDRLGMGKSPNILTLAPIPASETVKRLHDFLMKKQINHPYILIGHSIGGIYMQEFAKQFPEKVAGVVVIDSCVNAQMTATGWERYKPEKYLTEINYCCLSSEKINAEYCEVIAQKEHYSEDPFPNQIPLHVISAQYYNWGSETHKEQMNGWHKELAKQSQYGQWILAKKHFPEYEEHKNKDIAHFVHFFEPELVIGSVVEIIKFDIDKSINLRKNSKPYPKKSMLHQFQSVSAPPKQEDTPKETIRMTHYE